VLEVWGLFVSAFISSTIAPGGSEAVLAYLVAEQLQPVMLLVGVATVGNTLGALTTWWLGALAAKKYPAEHVLDTKKQKSLAWVRRWVTGVYCYHGYRLSVMVCALRGGG